MSGSQSTASLEFFGLPLGPNLADPLPGFEIQARSRVQQVVA